MKLREKVHQTYRLAHDAAWLSNLVMKPRSPNPEISSLPKKIHEGLEVQASLEEQIIYLMADTLIKCIDEDWQIVAVREFLKLKSVSSFMKESEWQGLAVHAYMLPHLAPDAQLLVFKSMCDLSVEKSDDFGAEMAGTIKDMAVSVRPEAVDYVQSKDFMSALSVNAPETYAADMSKLCALLPDEANRAKRVQLNHRFREAARENLDTQPEVAANQLRAAREIGKGRYAGRDLG